MLDRWPYPKAYKHVFDVADLQRTTFRETPLIVTIGAPGAPSS
jgi:hypothetical protein